MPRSRLIAMRGILAAGVMLLGATAVDRVALADSPVSGRWTLASMSGPALADHTKAFLEISASGDLTASGGCNRFSARATALTEGQSFQAYPIVNTARACLPELDKAEARFIETIRAARYFRMNSNTLILEDENRVPLLEFSKEQ